MKVQAEVSLYPLRTLSLSEPINDFLDRLSRPGMFLDTAPMSTRIEGESADVFRALREAFDSAAAEGNVVLTVKVSNACPPAK